MKVGILSMQRVINYGSYLQSYALKGVLEELGNVVRFVDIKKGEQVFSEHKNGEKKGKLDRYILKRVDHVIFGHRRKGMFEKIYFPQIGINDPIKESECDELVIGSDEVFNCCQSSPWGVSLQLLGKTDCPCISYAASAGYSSAEKVEDAGYGDKICSAIQNFRAISVRDKNTKDFVEKISHRDSVYNLDPVMIYDWNRVVVPQKKYNGYILIYGYDNRIEDEEEINAIKQFAKSEDKKIYSFGVYQRWCDKNIMCSPLELIAYFDAADYVITDTFHGTVISIKRNKPFATLIRDSNKNKLTDLLERFGLEDRAVAKLSRLKSILKKEIDFTAANLVIEEETRKAKQYLRENL